MSNRNLSHRTAVLAGAAAILLFGARIAAAQDTATAPAAVAAPKCLVPADHDHFDLPLSRVAYRLSGGLPIKIVALGSSSTWGAGASSPDLSYPSRLELELSRHFPGHEITVVNRGVNGEEAGDMLARMQTGVIAEQPHLVLWQVGTNSLLRDRPIDPRSTILHEGIAQLKAVRSDVVLIDPQFAPKVIAKAEVDAVVAQIEDTARTEKIGEFHRFEMMRQWHNVDGMPFDSFVSADGLHMNDWSYACLAKRLGFAIAEAATRPTATAAVPR